MVKTQSFELAVYQRGDVNASKLALVMPGKLDTKDYPHMRSHVDFLADKGFLAMSFDPPGTWASLGGIEIYNMTNYLNAINELIAYFGSRPTFVMGHSRGGSMAVLAGITNSKITGFAAIMSWTSFLPENKIVDPNGEWKNRGYAIERRDLPNGAKGQYKEYKLPYSFYEDQIQYDMREGLKKSSKPKLFFMGTKDSMVPQQIVKSAYELSHKPKAIHALHTEQTDHDYRKSKELIDEVNQVVGRFLEKYNL